MGKSPIVNRINSLLAERGIDKKKFYEDCGITSASYSLWNTGKTKPRMKNLEIIADYLRVPVSYLLEGKGQKEKPALQMENGLKEIDAIFEQLGSVAFTDKGLQSVGSHDDICSSQWLAALGRNLSCFGFKFSFM